MAGESAAAAVGDLGAVSFKGVFRDYQQKVLERANRHLADGKIHIVAAPGSGKTVLGLELVRGLGLPTLVLSPSVTIRQQWGDRFEEMFLPEEAALADYISFDIRQPRIITSITYQALHAAFAHLENEESADVGIDDENEGGEPTVRGAVEHEDFRDFDLVAAMTAANIKVLCLDEAHHLRSEWHKALESFIADMGGGLTVISLTATPPYDSPSSEWKRYEALCGPIDEEIFVPELVLKKTLCPHQDYIRFSFPTVDEQEALKAYRKKAKAALAAIGSTGLIDRALQATGVLDDPESHLATVLKYEAPFFTLFRMAKQFGSTLPNRFERMARTRLRASKGSSWQRSWKEFEKALQFILDEPTIFSAAITEELRAILAGYGLIERRKVKLLSDASLARLLISSMGKLQGITDIAGFEIGALGHGLRMLVLTDYIKKDLLTLIGTEAPITSMGAVPIFEALRRTAGESARIAVLSGSLVIVPDKAVDSIKEIASGKDVPCTFKQIGDTGYCEVVVNGSNKNKVSVMTEAFRQGVVNILVGTKSLLGEGWDSPCINSLILATFVGSFMLSNQMRGRAIRTMRGVPDKTANIWHLVTVEPVLGPDASAAEQLMFSELEHERDLSGDDWETLVRRFDCFMGPAYSRPVIESGIERIDILKPPFDRKGIAAINETMALRARDRAAMAASWTGTQSSGFYPVVERASELPSPKIPTTFTLLNALPFAAMVVAEAIMGLLFYSLVLEARLGEPNFVLVLVLIGVMAVVAVLLVRSLLRLARFLSPKRMVTSVAEAVLATLRQTGHIRSFGAKIRVVASPGAASISFGLRSATIFEQNVFAQAMAEMLSPIENPKFLLVRKRSGRYRYWHSYACPAVLASCKEDAEVLRENLSHLAGHFELVYTYNAQGRTVLWKSCCRSYVNANEGIFSKLTSYAEQ